MCPVPSPQSICDQMSLIRKRMIWQGEDPKKRSVGTLGHKKNRLTRLCSTKLSTPRSFHTLMVKMNAISITQHGPQLMQKYNCFKTGAEITVQDNKMNQEPQLHNTTYCNMPDYGNTYHRRPHLHRMERVRGIHPFYLFSPTGKISKTQLPLSTPQTQPFSNKCC